MPETTTEPRAKTLAAQGLTNRIIRGLLRTLYVVGRKSGRRYTVPVAYTRHDGVLLIGTPFGWGKNLRTGDEVELRFKRRRRTAAVVVWTDEAHVVERYAAMCRDNHNFARFNGIALDPAGSPDPHDLHLAWAGGARAIRLVLA